MQMHVKLSGVCKQYVIIIVANINMLLIGMDIGWLSPVFVKLRDADQTILVHPITEEEGTWMVSISFLTGFSFLVLVGYFNDKFGRKRCIIMATLPRFLICFLCVFGTDVWMLLLARSLCGFVEVMSLSTIPTYTSEIASKEIRGALGTITQIMSSLGMVIMLSVGPFVSYMTLNIIYTAMSCLPFITQVFIPESPYFLYVQDKKEETLEVLTSIRESIDIAREEIKEYTLFCNEKLPDKMTLLKDKTIIKSVLKAMFIGVAFQMVGYNTVTVYLQTIFESTHTNLAPEVASAVIGCVQLFACFCTIFISDRFGRKPILVVTLLGMALGLVGLGTFFKLTAMNVAVKGLLNVLPLVSLIVVIFCFNTGLGSLTWILIAELFDGPSRAMGMSFSIFATTSLLFLITKYFSSILNILGPATTYWIFSGNCVISCLFIMFFIPETKGRTFSEIQISLGRKLSEVESQDFK